MCGFFAFIGVLGRDSGGGVTNVSSAEVTVSRTTLSSLAGFLGFDLVTGKSGSGKSLMSVSKKSSLLCIAGGCAGVWPWMIGCSAAVASQLVSLKLGI